MSARKQVVFTTFSMLLPAASRIAFTLRQLCLVCSLIPSAMLPSAGFTGICPEVITILPVMKACEYGPDYIFRSIEELYKALPGQKSFEIVPQSGHNFQTGQNRQDLYKAIAGFLQAE